MNCADKLALWSAAAGAVAAVVFLALPQIDPAVVAWFYVEGEGFPFNSIPVLRRMSSLLRVAVIVGALTLLGMVVWSMVSRPPPWLPPRRSAAFLLAVLIIGPGIIVNTVFKDHWGRARPAQTSEFGGERTFSPPLVISDQCSRNCSFVSGDASVGFFLAAFGLVFARRRRSWIVLGLAAGVAIGILRVALGRHYPSDVVFSGVFVLLTAALLHRLMIGRNSPHVRSNSENGEMAGR